MGLGVSLKFRSRAKANYLELEGIPRLPSALVELPLVSVGTNSVLSIKGIRMQIRKQPELYRSVVAV